MQDSVQELWFSEPVRNVSVRVVCIGRDYSIRVIGSAAVHSWGAAEATAMADALTSAALHVTMLQRLVGELEAVERKIAGKEGDDA